MRNLFIVIGIMITSTTYGQRLYRNVGPPIRRLLDKHHIFYVGIKDRDLLSRNLIGDVHTRKRDLDSFTSLYRNHEFVTTPDTNRILFRQIDLLRVIDFEDEGEERAAHAFYNTSRIVGYKMFKVKGKYIDRIVLYELVVDGPYFKDFTTQCFTINKDGKWSIVYNF